MCEKKSFLKIGIIYTVGQVLSKAISFIMLPIYTRKLGAIEYGKLSLSDTVMDFISTFLIIGIFSGYTRFFRDYEESQRNKLRNTAITFACGMIIVDVVLFLMFGNFIANEVLRFNNAYYMVILIFIRSLISQFIVLLMCDYTLNYDAIKTVTINLAMLFFNVGFVLYLVLVKQENIFGVYKGYIYGSSLILIYLIFKNIKKIKFEFDKFMLKKMLIYSGGMIPSGISATVLNLADRYFLANFKGFSQTGIYSIGYKIGMLIVPLFISPFVSIFTPYKFEIYKSKTAYEKLNKMFKNYHIIGMFIVLGITLYSKFAIYILATNQYMAAYNIIPLILLSYFLYGKAEFYTIGIQIANKTYLDAIVMSIGGILNIILNILWIPKIGMYGATISTFLSYFVMNLMYDYISQRMYKIKFDNKTTFKVYVIYIVIFLLYRFICSINSNLIIEFFTNIVLLFLYVIMCIKFNLISLIFILKIIEKVKLRFKFLNRQKEI